MSTSRLVLGLLLGASLACSGPDDPAPTGTPSESPTPELPTGTAEVSPTAAPTSPPTAEPSPTSPATPSPTAGFTPDPSPRVSPTQAGVTPTAAPPDPSPSSTPEPTPLPATATPEPDATATPATPTVEPEPTATPTTSPLMPLLIQTTLGPVLGQEAAHDTFSWLGIPFAAPPVGDLRWQKPVDPQPWAEVFVADTLPPMCPQFEEKDTNDDGEPDLTPLGQEDCLYLNVWRPRTHAGEKKPVMMWIHGGGNVQGSSADKLYDGAYLAAKADVVLVTIEYRLNLFGFLNHPALHRDDTLTDSGNFATLDILKALNWVRDNAETFGGDSERVTVFGESAGGVNTWSMLMSPLATGQFHRAIIESGCFSTRTMDEAYAHADELLTTMVVADGLTTEEEAAAFLEAQSDEWIHDYLYGKSTEEFMTIFQADGGFPNSSFRPSMDGVVLPDGGNDDVVNGNLNKVPTLIGANRDEQKLFYYPLAYMTDIQYKTYMKALFGDDVEEIESYYPREAYDPATPYNQFIDILDVTFEPICSEYLSYVLSSNLPTWLYHFRYDKFVPPYDYIFGAAHGSELAFVFGAIDNSLYPPELLPERQTLSDTMVSYWSCMAYTGDPNCGTQPTWDAIQPGARSTYRRIVLNDTVEMEELPDINIDRINFWLDYYKVDAPPLVF